MANYKSQITNHKSRNTSCKLQESQSKLHTTLCSRLCALCDFSVFSVLKRKPELRTPNSELRIKGLLLILLFLYFLSPTPYSLSPNNSLYAQQLRLPDEEIIGVFSLTPDSLDVTKDYSDYFRVSQPERLNYRAVLERMINPDAGRNPFAYLYLQGYYAPFEDTAENNNDSWKGNVHLGLQSPSIPELNIYGMFSREEVYRKVEGYDPNGYLVFLDSSYLTQKMYFDWRPIVNYTGMGLRPAVFFQSSVYDYGYSDVYNNDHSMTALGVSLSANPENSRFLNRMNLSGKLLNLDYPHPYIDELGARGGNDFSEIDLNINLPRIAFISETDINIYNYYHEIGGESGKFGESFHGEVNFFFPIPFLNAFALNLQYSENFKIFEGFWTSLLFEKSFYVNEISELSISNFPVMRVPSLTEYFDYQPLAILADFEYKAIEYAQQVPLNAFIKYNLFTPTEMQFSLNNQYIKNHYYYGRNELRSWGWINEDAWIHAISVDIQKRMDNMSIAFKSTFMTSELQESKMKIPWEPHFETSISFDYRYKKYTFGINGTALMERYGNDMYPYEEKMDNVYLISVLNDFDITRNFKLSFNLNNILNQEYERMMYQPSPGFNGELVMKWMF